MVRRRSSPNGGLRLRLPRLSRLRLRRRRLDLITGLLRARVNLVDELLAVGL